MKPTSKTVIYLFFLFLIIGCDYDSPADLVSSVEFTETYRNVTLYLPDGVYTPDNPDFDIDKPETWTGNMAKYVNHNYLYSVSYTIRNLGYNIAYDTEIDLYYTYDNGDNKVETIYIGDIKPNESFNYSTSIGCTNKQLIECSCEVFWFE